MRHARKNSTQQPGRIRILTSRSDVEPPSELAEMYVLGSLDARDRESFEAHMANCARCRREVADVREFVEMLRLAARGIDPFPLAAVANRKH